MIDGRRSRRSSYSEETLEWLEKSSDKNILQLYMNRICEMPASKKRELESKGYIAGSAHARGSTKLYITEKGITLLNEIIEPVY